MEACQGGRPLWETGVARKLSTRHPCAGVWWQSSMEEHACASVWSTVLCQCFFQRVDRGETIRMVGSSTKDEVAGKSRLKKLSTARGSDR